jgi:aminoglycoside 2''-phosphotransferase
LHGLPTKCLEKDLPVHDGPDKWVKLYAEIQAHLFRFMRSDALTQVSDHFEAYLKNPDLHRYPTCLRHGDFGPSNILYDPEKSTLALQETLHGFRNNDRDAFESGLAEFV